jgi:hypothetical protein
MSAVLEAAMAEIRTELRKNVLQFLPRDVLHLLNVKGGKARRIHGKRIVSHGI